jgi:hypothetical protein
MIAQCHRSILILVVVSVFLSQGCNKGRGEIERPERILSKREIVYNDTTYARLAHLWNDYYDAFPSEDAYANWMYAARYAGQDNYESLLNKGLDKYPANPVLLYLAAMNTKHGARGNVEGRRLLEKAVRLDPVYMDPWFGLTIHYLADNDPENLDVALRHLLEGNAIRDEIMDYSYNMLASLDANAILITNGDNDTYPGWILTRILQFRPDVKIVNRSLLNTDWYFSWIIKEGVPNFINQSGLDRLREGIVEGMKKERTPIPAGGPFGDTLIVLLVDAAKLAGRPVYFAATLYSTDMVERYTNAGRNLGLVTLVTPSSTPYPVELKRLFDTWVNRFRTGGLDSWQFHHSRAAQAGRYLVTNYAATFSRLADRISTETPEYRLDLFRWYRDHLVELLSPEKVDQINHVWCREDSLLEIKEWCRSQGASR